MSWIGGSVVINDTSKTELDEAVMHITSHIRHEADLEEFPNICSRNRIVVKNETVFESFDDAEEYSKSSSNEFSKLYTSDAGAVALKLIRNISGTTIARFASQNSAPRL